MTGFRIASWRDSLSEEEALDSEFDMIPRLQEREHMAKFRDQLIRSQSQIETLVSHHLNISHSDFSLSQSSDWIWGGFNLPKGALIRFPVPFRNGEENNPGNVDEKLRCEAAVYALLQRNYPKIPIPRLFGIGFSNMKSFRQIGFEPLWSRLAWWWRRGLAFIRGDVLSPYSLFRRDGLDGLGYLLLEWVEDGRMLSSSWKKHYDDEQRRSNLYSGLARINLELSRIALPRIGSYTMDDRGVITLTNRPMSDLTLILNKHSIPTDSRKDAPFPSANCFVQSLITDQENRMRHQPNSILGRRDGIWQLSALAALRSMSSRFLNGQSRNGPFVLTLPDLHPSNIFVDEDWNLTRIIDLEFASVRPLQAVQVPSWLTSRGVDELTGHHLEEYRAQYSRFIQILEAEESRMDRRHPILLSQHFQDAWRTGGFWFFLALDSINAFPSIFHDHLRPLMFDKFQMEVEGVKLASQLDEKYEELIAKKLADLQRYKQRVHEIFEQAEAQSIETASRGTPVHSDQST